LRVIESLKASDQGQAGPISRPGGADPGVFIIPGMVSLGANHPNRGKFRNFYNPTFFPQDFPRFSTGYAALFHNLFLRLLGSIDFCGL
jgi:hypothetical protein